MGCGLPCEQEESYPGEQISNSSEDEFQVLSIGRYQMTVDNPKDMENPWRYEIDLFPIYIIKYIPEMHWTELRFTTIMIVKNIFSKRSILVANLVKLLNLNITKNIKENF